MAREVWGVLQMSGHFKKRSGLRSEAHPTWPWLPCARRSSSLKQILRPGTNYGIALTRSGDLAGARDAFRKTLKFDPNFIQARLRLAQTLLLADQPGEAEKEARASIQTNSSFAPAFLLKHKATLLTLARSNFLKPERREQQHQLLKDAIESLEKYFALAQPKGNNDFLGDQLETLRFYAKAAEEDPQAPGREVFFRQRGDDQGAYLQQTRAAIYRRRSNCSDARNRHDRGVLSADGNIEHILALQTLSFRFTGTRIE